MSYSQFVNDLKELKIKKKGKRPKVSPYKFYPSRVELEAQEALLDELKDYSRRLETAANSGSVEAVYGVLGATPESFSTKAYDIAQKVSRFNMLAFADFSNLVVGERYFPSQDNKNQILQTWTDNFVNLCKSTNEEMRKKVAGVVSDGVLSGRNLREMIKEVQNTCRDFSRNKAELIATTEVGKLNSAIARNQSESAGIEYYEWSAAMDGRTRESHALMDGKICKWGDDDHYWEWVEGKDGKRELKQRDRPAAAYKGAPGTDFRCRCVALPYVPEYEDDYEAEREKGEQRGVVQTHENPKPMSAEHIRFMNAINESRLMMNKSRDPGNIEANLLRKREKADYELQMARDYSDVSKRPYDKKLNSFYNLWCRKDGSDKLNEYLMRKNLGKGNPGNHPIFDEREKMMNDYIRSTPMRRDMTLWRAMSLNEATLNAYRKKKVIFNPGIASFSKSMEHSASFYDPNSNLKNKVSFFIQLHAKKGDSIAPPYRIKNGRMVGYPEESEFNSPSKSNLRIIEERDSNGILILECTLEG